jgi:hypothetical protein
VVVTHSDLGEESYSYAGGGETLRQGRQCDTTGSMLGFKFVRSEVGSNWSWQPNHVVGGRHGRAGLKERGARGGEAEPTRSASQDRSCEPDAR